MRAEHHLKRTPREDPIGFNPIKKRGQPPLQPKQAQRRVGDRDIEEIDGHRRHPQELIAIEILEMREINRER